jgi:hypothetical protein
MHWRKEFYMGIKIINMLYTKQKLITKRIGRTDCGKGKKGDERYWHWLTFIPNPA